jgi:hypothetical protein
MRSQFLAIILIFIATNAAQAGEASYMPVRKFLPLRQPSINQHSRQPLIINEAKFFPLAPNRYTAEPHAAESKNNIVTKNETELQPTPSVNQAGVKQPMTQQQAQQIISLFSQKQ